MSQTPKKQETINLHLEIPLKLFILDQNYLPNNVNNCNCEAPNYSYNVTKRNDSFFLEYIEC